MDEFINVENELKKFLKKYIVRESDEESFKKNYNHLGMDKFSGCYDIPSERYDELYYIITNGRIQNIPTCMLEKGLESESYIIADIDISSFHSAPTKLYTMEEVKIVIEIYQISKVYNNEKDEYEKNDLKRKEYTKEESINFNKMKNIVLELPKDVSVNFDTWIKVGLDMAYISKENRNEEEGLELFKIFSKKCPEKYDESICEKKWGECLKSSTYGNIGILINLQKESYKNFIDKIRSESENSHIDDKINFAKELLKNLFMGYTMTNFTQCRIKFKHVSTENEGSYIFNEGERIWVSDTSNHHIRKFIDEKFMPIFIEVYYSFLEESKFSKLEMNLVKRKIEKLDRESFRKEIYIAMDSRNRDDKFPEKLDTRQDVIAFKNGTYNLKNNILREGRYDDYLSKDLGVDYLLPKENVDNVVYLYNFLSKVLMNKEKREFFFRYLF